MGSFLNNVSVAGKLVLGFSLPFVCSMLLAGLGLYGTSGITVSHERVNRLSTLFDNVVYTRESNYEYAITQGVEFKSKTKEHLERIENNIQSLKNDIERGAWPLRDSSSIDEMGSLIQMYKNSDMIVSTSSVISQNQILSNLLDLVNELYENEANRVTAQLSKTEWLLILIGILSCLFCLSAAWLIGRQIVTPLKHAVSTAECIARGDLTQHIKHGHRDELGVLLEALDNMQLGLRSTIQQIGAGANNLAVSAFQLTSLTKQTQEGIERQKIDTDSVAISMDQMVIAVQEVASHAERTASAATAVDHEVLNALSLSQRAANQIGVLHRGIGESAQSMEELQQASLRIIGILNVIKEVADQTNLLALNAAIEAARAGEAGRGFAVVAEEVRNLAQRTQQSSGEIETLVSELSRIAERSVETMKFSVEQTESSVDIVNTTRRALEVTNDSISEIQQMSELIATAVVEQSSVADEISRSLAGVRDVAEVSATSSLDISFASNEIKKLSEEQDALVKKFNV